jgi:antitoxin YefM
MEQWMKTITVAKARSELCQLIDKASRIHQPIQITGKRANAILLSEEDWRAIQETLNLTSIPGMRESIREGLETFVNNCTENLEW